MAKVTLYDFTYFFQKVNTFTIIYFSHYRIHITVANNYDQSLSIKLCHILNSIYFNKFKTLKSNNNKPNVPCYLKYLKITIAASEHLEH